MAAAMRLDRLIITALLLYSIVAGLIYEAVTGLAWTSR